MDIPQLDRSNYLKGLLITARRDNQLAESEITIIKKLAARLGFSSDFFEETISHLLENKYITEEPIKFSNQETANENGIGEAWFNKKFKELQNKSYQISKTDFALFSII